MTSFIKFIADVSIPYNPDWLVDPDKMFRSLSTRGKITYLMSQAVILNYLDRVYHAGCPSLITEYKDKVTKWWMTDLEYEMNNIPQEENAEQLKEAYLSILALLGMDASNQVDAKVCEEILVNQIDDAPIAVKNTFYSPYLRFAERARRSETLAEGDHAQNTESFSVPGPVTLPTVTYQGEVLSVRHDLTYPSYKYNYTDNHRYGTSPYGLGVESIFAYWRGYNWGEYKFNSVVGVLAAQCLEYDPNTFPKNSLQWAYYDIYCKVTGWRPKGVGESTNIWLSSELNFLRRCVLSFLVDVRDKYKITFDDSELLGKLVQGDTAEDADQLRAFLTAAKPSEVSVEMYNAFQRSIFAHCGELDLMHVRRLSSRELMDLTISSENSKAYSSDAQQDEPASSSRYGYRRSRPSYEADEMSDADFDKLDQDSGITQDEQGGADDAQDEPDQPADNGEGGDTGADTTPDEEPTDPATTPDGTEDQTQHDTHTPVSDMPDMDDKRGVTLELSGGETANSVLYRIELESFIDSLLANPPDHLSAQKVEFLKRVRAYWLNRLSPESLVNLLNSIVKLPKELNVKPKKKEAKGH